MSFIIGLELKKKLKSSSKSRDMDEGIKFISSKFSKINDPNCKDGF